MSDPNIESNPLPPDNLNNNNHHLNKQVEVIKEIPAALSVETQPNPAIDDPTIESNPLPLNNPNNNHIEIEVPTETPVAFPIETQPNPAIDDDALPPPPPNKKSNKGSWLVIALWIIVMGTGIGFAWTWWENQQAEQAKKAAQAAQAAKNRTIPVKLVTIKNTTVRTASDYVGNLTAKQVIPMRTQVDGRVVNIFVARGQTVKTGDILVQMQSDERIASLRESEAARARAKANLDLVLAGTRQEEIAQQRSAVARAKASLRNAQSGSLPQQISAAQANLAKAKAQENLASKQVSRYRGLEAEGAVSKDTLDQFVREAQVARAEVVEAQKNVAQLVQDRDSQIRELTASLRQEEELLQEKLNGSRPEDIAQAKAQLAQAEANVNVNKVKLNDTKIVARFAGTVGDIPVKVGDYLKTGDQVTILTQNKLLDLRISVPLQRLPQLKLGLPVQIIGNDNKVVETGEISFISPDVDPQLQLVTALVTYKNTSGKLVTGQFVKARIIWQTQTGLLVPTTAVTRIGGESFVFVAEKQGEKLVARQKPIKIGPIQGQNYQVVSGLKNGEQVINSGVLNVKEGAALTPIK